MGGSRREGIKGARLMAFDLDGYVDVAERIGIFREKYPEGSLQPADLSRPFWIEEVGGRSFVCYAAAAYRTPDDPRPGIGVAWEPFPGPTPYTKDSEAMNAETSAWGRAIVASLAADTQKIASAQEVRNRQADSANTPADGAGVPASSRPASGPRLATDKQRRLLESLIEAHTVPDGCAWPLAEDLTMRDCSGYIDTLKKLPPVENKRVATKRDEVVPDPVANAIQDKLDEVDA